MEITSEIEARMKTTPHQVGLDGNVEFQPGRTTPRLISSPRFLV